MSLIFIDSFHSGDASLWDYVSTGASVTSDISGMNSKYSLYFASNSMVYKNLPSADEYTIGFYYKVSTSANAEMIVGFLDGGTLLGELRRNTSSGYLEAYRGTTKIATGIQTISNRAYHIQVRYVPHVSNGYFQVKVDNVIDINFAGATVDSSAQINRIALGSESVAASAYFSNVVIDDSGFPGMLLVGAFSLTANGYLNEWTASAGQNYQCVDEAPASDTDYVYATAVDKIDFYAGSMTDINNVSTIKAVQVQARSRLMGEPDANQIKLGVRTASTNYFGDAQDVGVSAKSYFAIWTENPNSEEDWTKTDLGSLQIGIQSAGA